MRDRLIELIKSAADETARIFKIESEECLKKGELPQHKRTIYEIEADYLLANDVIAPPCKIGDVVYVNPKSWSGLTPLHYDNCFIHSAYFLVAEVVSVIKTRKQNLIKLKVYNKTNYTPEYRWYPISSIGKTVFLTREGVIKALKGGEA